MGGGTGVTGQLTKITNGLDTTKNRFYEYDALARLTKAKGGNTGTDWSQDYDYDRYGNRKTVTKSGSVPLDAVNPGGTATSFALSFTNQQGQTLNNRITTSGYEYDNAGNLTRGQDPDGTWQKYEYDAANRLKCVKNDAGTTTLATYTYGASNQRLKTVDGSATNTWYVWEGGKVIAEYNTVASVHVTWQKNYVYLGERLLATESTATALQFHHPDRLGSRLVTNASDGSSGGEQESLPFGTAMGAGISGNNRRFTSYDRSTTTKLDYAVNRTYNAGLGRFTQVDPIGMGAVSLFNPQSLNLYAYCFNDPINHADPDGLDGGATIIVMVVIAVLGLLRNLFGGGKRVRTAPIMKQVTVRETRGISSSSVWTQVSIQAGVGGVSAFLNQRENKKKKEKEKKPCPPNLKALARVDELLKASGLDQYITNKTVSESGAGYTFKIDNPEEIQKILDNKDVFKGGGDFGSGMHRGELRDRFGASNGKHDFPDYRSIKGKGKLSKDRSLQIDLIKDEDGNILGGYADTDKYSPKQGVGSGIGHTGEVFIGIFTGKCK